MLLFEIGPNRGETVALPSRAATIGRHPKADVRLFDEESAERHAQIAPAPGGATAILFDLAEGYAGAVNGLPIHGTVEVRPGDRIRLGATVARFLGTYVTGLAPARVGRVREPTPVYGSPATVARERGGGRPPASEKRVLPLIATIPEALGRGARLETALAALLEDGLAALGGGWAALYEAGSPRPIAATALAPEGTRGEGIGFPLEWQGRPVGTLRVGSDESGCWSGLAIAIAPYLGDRLPPAPDANLGAVDLVANTPAMRRVVEMLRKVAGDPSTVLLVGESGTGKELAARAIQANGPRARAPFVTVNAAALAEGVLESELFGHERGAFTGAVARRAGVFALADHGTLFLDEIGEITPATQAKLLRVLETGEIRPVGARETRHVDVRVIAATNRDLRALVRDGRFREDLYYRLAVVEIRIPPLRERGDDLVPLCHELLARLARERGVPAPALADDAIEALRAYDFPGNVRELKNVLERALILGDARVVRAADLGLRTGTTAVARGASPESFVPLEEVERRHIAAALRLTGWNKKRAAELLRVDRKTLYAKIASYGLRRDGQAAPPEEPADAAPETSR